MLPVLRSAAPISLQKLFDYRTHELRADWDGKTDTPLPRFIIAVDPVQFYFGVEVYAMPHCDKSLAVSEYQEGLWEKDVAEIFLADDADANRYQEFNLSPAGAWWSHSFLKPRERDLSGYQKPRGVECVSHRENAHWRAAIAVPRKSLSISCEFSNSSRANVCFILGAPQQRFFSWSKIQAPAPDFHRPEYFEKIAEM